MRLFRHWDMPRKGAAKKKKKRAKDQLKASRNLGHSEFLQEAEYFGSVDHSGPPGDLKHRGDDGRSSGGGGGGGSGGGGGGGRAAIAIVPSPGDFPGLSPTQQLAAVDFLEGSDGNEERQQMEVLALGYARLIATWAAY